MSPALQWGLPQCGLLRPGYATDVVVFDPRTIGPQMLKVVHDLPAGERRLKQKADGILPTIVNGEILLREQEHTGALPGQLLRRGLKK